VFSFDARTRALLDAVARLESVSAAARSLGMDPSNAHRHLRTAAARAGAPLVRRAGNGARVLRPPEPGALVGRALAYDADEGTTPVVVGGRRTLHVAGRVPEGPVTLAFRPQDVTLVREARPSSARNRVPGRVARLREAGEGTWLVDVAAGGLAIPALVTRGARRELRLREGSRVVAVLKATAIRAEPVPRRHENAD
jgi:molybdopterin-binding protein